VQQLGKARCPVREILYSLRPKELRDSGGLAGTEFRHDSCNTAPISGGAIAPLGRGKSAKGLHLTCYVVQYRFRGWVQNRLGIRSPSRHMNTAMPHPVERMRGCRYHGSPDGKEESGKFEVGSVKPEDFKLHT
jgi:hypothetical protein